MPIELLTHKRKIRPSHILCADCVKIKKLIEDEDHCLILNEKREIKTNRKQKFKELGNVETISNSYLRRKYKLTFSEAENILKEIFLLNTI